MTPGDVVDGAEERAGQLDRDLTTDDNPVSAAEAASGTSSFHLLAGGGPGQPPDPEILTWNRTVLPTATSTLSFDGLYFNSKNETAAVQVSTDSGATWQSVFAETPPSTEQDTAFTHKTVSLAAFAGEQIQVRFALTFTGSLQDGWLFKGGEPQGWYFDNVAFNGVLNAGNRAGPGDARPVVRSQHGAAGMRSSTCGRSSPTPVRFLLRVLERDPAGHRQRRRRAGDREPSVNPTRAR